MLVIAGMADRLVPPALTQQLYEAAPGPKQLVLVPGAEVLAALRRFLADTAGLRSR